VHLGATFLRCETLCGLRLCSDLLRWKQNRWPSTRKRPTLSTRARDATTRTTDPFGRHTRGHILIRSDTTKGPHNVRPGSRRSHSEGVAPPARRWSRTALSQETVCFASRKQTGSLRETNRDASPGRVFKRRAGFRPVATMLVHFQLFALGAYLKDVSELSYFQSSGGAWQSFVPIPHRHYGLKPPLDLDITGKAVVADAFFPVLAGMAPPAGDPCDARTFVSGDVTGNIALTSILIWFYCAEHIFKNPFHILEDMGFAAHLNWHNAQADVMCSWVVPGSPDFTWTKPFYATPSPEVLGGILGIIFDPNATLTFNLKYADRDNAPFYKEIWNTGGIAWKYIGGIWALLLIPISLYIIFKMPRKLSWLHFVIIFEGILANIVRVIRFFALEPIARNNTTWQVLLTFLWLDSPMSCAATGAVAMVFLKTSFKMTVLVERVFNVLTLIFVVVTLVVPYSALIQVVNVWKWHGLNDTNWNGQVLMIQNFMLYTNVVLVAVFAVTGAFLAYKLFSAAKNTSSSSVQGAAKKMFKWVIIQVATLVMYIIGTYLYTTWGDPYYMTPTGYDVEILLQGNTTMIFIQPVAAMLTSTLQVMMMLSASTSSSSSSSTRASRVEETRVNADQADNKRPNHNVPACRRSFSTLITTSTDTVSKKPV